jgi:mannosyltransferase OCH1-like enzyme
MNIPIPKKIFRFWHTELGETMEYYSNKMKIENPDFEYTVFNPGMARAFLIEHFDEDVIHAFDSLVPIAFKSDLFRYCVLYIHGGIYLDMKFESMDGFTFNDYLDKEYYVLDIDGDSIYNAFFICEPKSIIMFKSIFQILKHVKNREYTDSDLAVTGPGMLKKIVSNGIKKNSVMIHKCIDYEKYIYKDNTPIFKSFPRYYEDTPKCQHRSYYDYWRCREVFVDPKML